jgi:hypothetical protein
MPRTCVPVGPSALIGPWPGVKIVCGRPFRLIRHSVNGTGCVNQKDSSTDVRDDQRKPDPNSDIPSAAENQAVKHPWLAMSHISSEGGKIGLSKPTIDVTVASNETEIPPSKRRLVRTACLPCRKRKSKVSRFMVLYPNTSAMEPYPGV